MKDKTSGLSAFCIEPDSSCRQAIACIDKNQKGIALVVGKNGKIMGTLTDGDIRRAILRKTDLNDPVTGIMRSNPTTAPASYTKSELMILMDKHDIRHIPIVDKGNRLVDMVWIGDLTKEQFIPAKAVIMAGGYGSRLQPLTNDTPKPMLQIWGKPILEVIIEHLRDFGVREFYITTRYKAEKIEEYFKDGAHLKLNIHYIKENKRLGTAGALSLIEDQFDAPFIVINSDILTKLNFKDMYNFHLESNAKMTVAVRKYDLQVPFGVVEIKGERITGISEKPLLEYFVNAGVYILNPEVRELIPYNQHMDITDLIKRLIQKKKTVCSFPIHEYWMDIGRFVDFEKAHLDIINNNY